MRAAAYHIQDVLDKFKNLKQFSGQCMNPLCLYHTNTRYCIFFIFCTFFTGVEKNNDVARSIVLRKSNNFDSPAEVIRAEHRINTLYKRERRKREYKKVVTEYWNGGKQEASKTKKQKCISIQKPDASNKIVENDGSISEEPTNVQQRNVQKGAKKAKKTKRKKQTKKKIDLTMTCI